MKTYDNIETLLQDESFLNYYFKKDEASIWEWEDWMEDDFERQQLIAEACHVLDKLSLKWTEQQIKHKFLLFKQTVTEPPTAIRNTFWYWTGIAAAISCILLGIWLFFEKDTTEPVLSQLVEQSHEKWINISNTSEQARLITLNDGSSILLQKNSKLSYPVLFKANQRQVYLSGEAFFEIAKDPSRPFFVYTSSLTTKVLGTSFVIKAYPNQGKAQIVVRTGKVSVYAETVVDALSGAEATVITANQQLSFDANTKQFDKSLVAEPQILQHFEPYNFTFKDTPASEVFAKMQVAYGVTIIFDEDVLKNCPITASLNDEPLYDKLNLICTAIEAHYELIDGQIVINSHGCR
jgi:transmembrane sensor